MLFQDSADVLVLTQFVAVLAVGAIAVVWPVVRSGQHLGISQMERERENTPKPMHRPMVRWTGGGASIPELRLQELAPWVIEAAEVWDGCGVGAAKGEVEAVF